MQKIIRIAVIAIVSLILLNSLFFVIVGVYRSVHAYMLIAQGRIEERPGLMIVESLDSFMVALFFIIFFIGISKLFLPKSNFITGFDLPWLKVENFSQLKYIMWEVLLTAIFVYFGTKLIVEGNSLNWTLLIYPASILMLALAYKLLKQSH